MLKFYLIQMPQLKMPAEITTAKHVKGSPVDGLSALCVSRDTIDSNMAQELSQEDAQAQLDAWAVWENDNATTDPESGETPAHTAMKIEKIIKDAEERGV